MLEVELDESQVATFRRDGYLVIESAFTDDELAAFRDASDRIVELSINSTLALGRRHPRLDAKVHDDGRVTIRKLQPINDLDVRLAAIASDERLLAPLRQLMGDEPILMEEKLNPKQTLDTIALDLAVLTSSHLIDAPLIDGDPTSGSGVVADGFFSLDDLVPLDAPAGSVLLFHAKLVHDSEPNRSGRPRRVMIYSHYPRSHDPTADPDRRNGPVRAYSRAFEDEYRELVDSGAFQPQFTLSSL